MGYAIKKRRDESVKHSDVESRLKLIDRRGEKRFYVLAFEINSVNPSPANTKINGPAESR